MSNVVCPRCGAEHHILTKCMCDAPEIKEDFRSFIDRIPWWMKYSAGGVVMIGLAGSLPATVTTLGAAGVLIGGMWVIMVLMPMGDWEKDWLAKHPRTFMLLHVPATFAIAKLGEGLLMAFGNLAGGVIATLWLMNWGRKRGIGMDGKPTERYIPPQPSKAGLRAAQSKYAVAKGVSWLLSSQS